MGELFQHFCKVKLLKYSIFLGSMAGIASWFGPDRDIFIKYLIGITIGLMILGDRFPKALRTHFKWIHERNQKEDSD